MDKNGRTKTLFSSLINRDFVPFPDSSFYGPSGKDGRWGPHPFLRRLRVGGTVGPIPDYRSCKRSVQTGSTRETGRPYESCRRRVERGGSDLLEEGASWSPLPVPRLYTFSVPTFTGIGDRWGFPRRRVFLYQTPGPCSLVICSLGDPRSRPTTEIESGPTTPSPSTLTPVPVPIFPGGD